MKRGPKSRPVTSIPEEASPVRGTTPMKRGPKLLLSFTSSTRELYSQRNYPDEEGTKG